MVPQRAARIGSLRGVGACRRACRWESRKGEQIPSISAWLSHPIPTEPRHPSHQRQGGLSRPPAACASRMLSTTASTSSSVSGLAPTSRSWWQKKGWEKRLMMRWVMDSAAAPPRRPLLDRSEGGRRQVGRQAGRPDISIGVHGGHGRRNEGPECTEGPWQL